MTATALADGVDWLDCSCGNDPTYYGFYPSTSNGLLTCPSLMRDGCDRPHWDGRHVVCAQCGAVYVQPESHTRSTELVAVHQRSPLSLDEQYQAGDH